MIRIETGFLHGCGAKSKRHANISFFSMQAVEDPPVVMQHDQRPIKEVLML